MKMVNENIVGYEGEVEVEEEEKEMEMGILGSPQQQMKLVVVGYALTSKKTKSFLQPKLVGLARNKGIQFVAIDQSRPLSDQGPFDIVLHKLSGSKWSRILEDYRQTHPHVAVLDPPDAIEQVYNRQYMLEDVADLNLSDSDGTVGVPRQLVIENDPSSISDAVNKAGLALPLVAKPLVAKSHELSLAYDMLSLQKLEPPLVLQEFINHGGVLFKVFIVGEAVKVVRRFSLPDVSKRELSKSAGVFHFPRVSCVAASAEEADLDPCVGALLEVRLLKNGTPDSAGVPGRVIEGSAANESTPVIGSSKTITETQSAELPPRPLLERLARELRRRLGLRLFNLDIIREHGTQDRYYVIDINYFPGYGKMPEYEHIFTEFLLSLMKQK